MKALLIKDLRLLLRQQRVTMVFFVAVIILATMATENPMFGIVYVVFLLPSLLIATISYDSHENGMLYLMSLPVSWKTYVAEKYLLSVGGSVIINLLTTGAISVFCNIKGGEHTLAELLICSFTAQISILIYCALSMPVNLRFGVEKGRIVMIIMMILVGAILGGSASIQEDEAAMQVLGNMAASGMAKLLFGVLLVCVLFTIGSYLVTIKWMEKKEY